MRDRRRTAVAALAGGVVLASAGLAIGSQLDDGSADARDRTGSRSAATARPAHFDRRGDRGFASLADRLGVSEAKLRDALDALRPDRDADEAALAASIAKALGIDEQKVKDALAKLRAQHEQREEQEHAKFAAALAKALGMDAEKVKAALDKVKPDRDAGPPARDRDRRDLLGDLAKELGVTQAKLRAALQKARPEGPGGRFDRHERGHDGPPPPPPNGQGAPAPAPPPPGGRGGHRHGPGGPGGPMADDLAQELGVDADKLRDALEAFEDQRHDEFAQKLADKLGLDVDKVEEALRRP